MPDSTAAATPSIRADSVLGFDFGMRRIGMAVGQRITGTAQALAVVGNGPNGPQWPTIETAVRDWQPQALIVGLPLTMAGEEQPASRAARAFGAALRKRFALPVFEQDERMSSIEAGQRFVQARRDGTRRAKHAANLDSMAAQIIVENYFTASAA